MSPYTIIAGLVLSMCLTAGGYWKGYTDRGNSDMASTGKTEKVAAATTLTAVLDRQATNTATAAADTAKNIQGSIDHEKANTTIQSDLYSLRAAVAAAGGLRLTGIAIAGPWPGLSTAPDSDGRHHDPAACTVELSEADSSDIWAEAERAEKIVEQLRAAENWIKAHGFYPDPPPTIAKETP